MPLRLLMACAHICIESHEGNGHALLQVGTIENEYRVFQMEVLAGPPCLDTEVSQHGARFRLNFGEVRGRQVGRRLVGTALMRAMGTRLLRSPLQR